MHMTAGALLVRDDEILLVEYRAYGIVLQPGGHLEPTDTTLLGAAIRELVEETGVDASLILPTSQASVYVFAHLGCSYPMPRHEVRTPVRRGLLETEH